MSKAKKQNSSCSISFYYLTSLKKLCSKYNSFENSYELICINNLIYTENCHIVARFKDFLYYDDSTEFLQKYCPMNDLFATLKKIFNFYTQYCKVFPNYMILPENEFLYRNLRKKQKLIDQFNEIKKEELENRNHLRLKKNKDNENDYILFNKKVQDSIEKYKPSFTQSTIIMMDYINFNNNEKKETKTQNEDSITISLNYNNTKNYDLNDIDSNELTLISITNMMNTTPKKNSRQTSAKGNKLSFTPPKKKLKDEKIEQKINNGFNNKKFISHYQNIKNTNGTNNNENINNNNFNNQKKEMKKNYTNNIIDTTKKINANNISQNKTSNTNNINIFISSITKTTKESNNKTIVKSIKSNITKKKLFTTTEKTITHKKPIYNHKNIVINKNSNSINSNKYKKNYQEIISISMKPSISPPNTKLNGIKLKLIDNAQSNILVYNNKNNSNNNISYSKNKNMKSFQLIDNSDTDKKNISNNKNDKKLNKNNSNNLNNGKKTVKEIMKNYKNILKTKKNSHYSHDINKNNLFLNNKNLLCNLADKNIPKNVTNGKARKNDPHNKYISPINKKDVSINGNNPKTPFKPDIKMNNKYQNMIIKTKEASQAKIQNYIKKILDKNNNKKNFFINQSKTKQ